MIIKLFRNIKTYTRLAKVFYIPTTNYQFCQRNNNFKFIDNNTSFVTFSNFNKVNMSPQKADKSKKVPLHEKQVRNCSTKIKNTKKRPREKMEKNTTKKARKTQIYTKPIANNQSIKNYCLIVFDLETSGLDMADEILQIGAVCGDYKFNVYITPLKQISRTSSAIHHLTCKDDILYYQEEAVDSCLLETAISDLISWIDELPCSAIMVGHNIKYFDCPRLMKAVIKSNLLSQFSEVVVGFVDTLPLYRDLYPKFPNHKQTTVVEHLLGINYNAHNAMDDVLALQKSIYCRPICDSVMYKHSFSLSSYSEFYMSKYY